MSPRKHSEYQDLLEQHVSGEPLSPAERLSLFDHIEDCDDCRQILEAETRVTARMKAVPRLVAPSDLRSKILSQAVRDHRERTMTPSEDPTVADLLRARDRALQDQSSQQHQTPVSIARPPSMDAAERTPKPLAPHRLHEDLPVFAGIARPAPSRMQRAWRRASPVLATAFLAGASVMALYAGQFQGIPLAGDAQQVVWAMVNGILKDGNALLPQSPGPSRSAPIAVAGSVRDADALTVVREVEEPLVAPVANSTRQVALAGAGQDVWDQRRDAAATFQQRDAAALQHGDAAGSFGGSFVSARGDLPPSPDMTTPLPGTDAVVDWMRRLRAMSIAADSTVAALSRAASEPVPAPAENARPQIAALVLRATDRDAEVGGFRDSELAAALERVARTQPGGRIARQDQFAMDGHRYRLYTLDLPAGFTNRIVETLTPYQAPADVLVVNALASQAGAAATRGGNVHFYSSNESRLRSALQNIQPVVSGGGASERVRIVVVE